MPKLLYTLHIRPGKPTIVLLLVLCLFSMGRAWNTVGMGGGGAQYGPSISPLNSNLRFVGSDMSGWYRSTDGGVTWNTLDFYQISTDVDGGFNNGVLCAMAFHPANANIVYGYGRQQDSQNNPSNLLVSNDGGQTFSVLNPSPPWGGRVTVIYLDRGNANFMLIGTDTGVYISTNGGTSFSGPSGSSGYVSGIVVDQSSPAGNRTCYAGTDAGVFKSTNNGASWTAANTGLPAGASALGFAGASTASGSRLFEIDATDNIIYTSTNAAAWTQSSAADTFSMIACADNDTATAYATNGGNNADRSVWKTTDGGNTWTEVFIDVNPAPNVSMGWISYDQSWSWGAPNDGLTVNPADSTQAMFANMGETFLSNDGGATWQEAYSTFSDTAPRAAGKKWASCGLEMTSVWHYDIDPNNSNYHYICYTDIGFARSTDAGNTWYDTGRKGSVPSNWTNTFYQIAFNPTPGVILAAVSGLHDLDHSNPLGKTGFSGGVAKSTNYGATWAQSSTGLPVSPTTSIVFDPANNVYFVTVWGFGVYKSTDATGSNWAAVSPVAIGTNRNVYSLKLINGTLYCLLSGQKGFANAGGLFKSTNQGNTWTNIALSVDSGGNPLYYPMEFDVNPADQNIIFLVGQDNNKGGYQGGCYKTINGGTSWTLMTMPVGATPYGYAPSIDPGNTNTVYFGTENQGFFKTLDNGNTWARETGVPFSSIQRLTFAPDALYVCTFGGGVWKEPKVVSPTQSPTSTAPGATATRTNTFTATPTATGTRTFSPTASASPSASETGTSTDTVTRTVTPTNSATITETFTITETSTPVPPGSTDTDTPTATPTFTETFVNTATRTATMTRVVSFTCTRTLTQTPVFTQTNTPTQAAGEQPLAFNSCGIYPNPFNYGNGQYLNIAIDLSRTDIDGITLEIYSMAFRKVREKHLDGVNARLAAASGIMQYDAAYLKGMGAGVYYYVVTAERGGEKARSRADVLILMRGN